MGPDRQLDALSDQAPLLPIWPVPEPAIQALVREKLDDRVKPGREGGREVQG
jgi:hypothetical protein